jgi:hypothetical protein
MPCEHGLSDMDLGHAKSSLFDMIGGPGKLKVNKTSLMQVIRFIDMRMG